MPALLVAAGLKLGELVGDGDVVRSQDPPPRTLVLPGSAVNVSATSAPPQRLVTVPDLTGLTLEETRRVLEAVGLVLFEGAPSEERVVGQQPVAGVLVRRGSTVTVTVDEALVPPEEDDDPNWAVLVVAALLVLGAATAAAVEWRRAADRRWLRAHAQVAGRPGPVNPPRATTGPGQDGGSGRLVVQVRGVPGRDGQVTVREVE